MRLCSVLRDQFHRNFSFPHRTVEYSVDVGRRAWKYAHQDFRGDDTLARTSSVDGDRCATCGRERRRRRCSARRRYEPPRHRWLVMTLVCCTRIRRTCKYRWSTTTSTPTGTRSRWSRSRSGTRQRHLQHRPHQLLRRRRILRRRGDSVHDSGLHGRSGRSYVAGVGRQRAEWCRDTSREPGPHLRVSGILGVDHHHTVVGQRHRPPRPDPHRGRRVRTLQQRHPHRHPRHRLHLHPRQQPRHLSQHRPHHRLPRHRHRRPRRPKSPSPSASSPPATPTNHPSRV